MLKNGTKNGTTFGTLSSRLSEVQMKQFWELNESGGKFTGAGIILDKRKGGISSQEPYKGITRPYKGLKDPMKPKAELEGRPVGTGRIKEPGASLF